MTTANDSWQRIHNWLSTNAPRILGNLNPPANDSELNSAEKAFGCKMPDEWHELYRIHNGMNHKDNVGNLFYGMGFLPLHDAVRQHGNSNKSGEFTAAVRAADGAVKKVDIYNPRWIPLAHDGGDTLLRVDMDPSPEGKLGQVIFTDHADDTVIVLAGGIAQLLADFAAGLERGQYFLNKEALADGNHFLGCATEVDIINWHRAPRWKHLKRG